MHQINLLRSIPKSKRDIKNRSAHKTPEIVAESKKFGHMYFDGPREYGYGGYKYDGRWINVAKDIISHYDLKPGMRVLDIGCAKGFLVKDLMTICPRLEVYGLDISTYALMNCDPEVVGRLHQGDARKLPFPDHSFDLVLAINTIHNFKKPGVIKALQEIKRVSRQSAFVQVDSYCTQEDKLLFENWVLTAKYHGYPKDWLDVFEKAGYKHDYDWTILEG